MPPKLVFQLPTIISSESKESCESKEPLQFYFDLSNKKIGNIKQALTTQSLIQTQKYKFQTSTYKR